MANYRKILVAFDGSPSSTNALIQASRLAREQKSWIKVLAVVPDYRGDLELLGVANIREAIEGPGKEILARAKKVADAEDVHILTDLEQGEPYEQIVHVAEDENCDLIVMGRRGRSHLERELMGSVTARVIGHTNKNILVVPEQGILSWEHLLLATDGSASSEPAATLAAEIAKEQSSQLTAVTVVYTNDEFMAMAPDTVNTLHEEAQEILETFKSRPELAGLTVNTEIREGEAYQAITELAADIKAGVIIMGTYGRKGLYRLLMGSATERTIGYAPCPVLVVH